MKIKQVGLFLGTLLLTLSSYANLKSSSITLIGGTIKPHETLTIALTSLLPGVKYNVTAKINDANNKKNKVILKAEQVGEYGYSWWGITLNGRYISGSQFMLNQVDNTVDFELSDCTTPITITNLDDADSVIVTAVATPSVSN
ncbi:MAG: hypothetical protein H0U71_09850 [Gammaproteobacteria bacterium]|nr:hypothetical protein [Gammaproteobacteria bacterium]